MLFLLQEHGGEHAAEGHVHEPPYTIFTGLWKSIKDTKFGHWYGFDNPDRDLGRFWFDATKMVACIPTSRWHCGLSQLPAFSWWHCMAAILEPGLASS